MSLTSLTHDDLQMNEDDLEKQQLAYKVEGVDENAPAVDLRKRKAQDGDDSNVRIALP